MPNIVLLEATKKGTQYPILITEKSGNDLKDYPVLIKLTSENFFAWGFVDPKGRNIVIKDENNYDIPFWVERIDNVNKIGYIWVKPPLIPKNSTIKLYLYILSENINNPYNDPKKVFLFFDHFDEGLDGWSVYIRTTGIGTITVENSLLKIVQTQDAPYFDDMRAYKNVGISGNGYSIMAYMYLDIHDYWEGGGLVAGPIGGTNYGVESAGKRHGSKFAYVKNHNYYGMTILGYFPDYTLDDVGWYRVGISWAGSVIRFQLGKDVVDYSSTFSWNGVITFSSTGVAHTIYVDWVLVRPFITVEPEATVLPPLTKFKGTYDLY